MQIDSFCTHNVIYQSWNWLCWLFSYIYWEILKARSYLAQLCALVAAVIVAGRMHNERQQRMNPFCLCQHFWNDRRKYNWDISIIRWCHFWADSVLVTRRSYAASSRAKLLATLHFLLHDPWWKPLTPWFTSAPVVNCAGVTKHHYDSKYWPAVDSSNMSIVLYCLFNSFILLLSYCRD